MKKIFFIICFLFLSFSSAYAANSKEFTFAWRLLGSLHFCQWATDYKTLPDFFRANEKLRNARLLMEKYVNDKDEHIRMAARGIAAGVDNLIGYNNKVAEKIIEAERLNPEKADKLDLDTIKTNDQTGRGQEIISLSAGRLLAVIIEPVKTNNPSGPLSFKISKEERQKLLQGINDLFADNLKKYDEHKGKNPEARFWVISIVAKLRDTLSCETYERLRLKGL